MVLPIYACIQLAASRVRKHISTQTIRTQRLLILMQWHKIWNQKVVDDRDRDTGFYSLNGWHFFFFFLCAGALHVCRHIYERNDVVFFLRAPSDSIPWWDAIFVSWQFSWCFNFTLWNAIESLAEIGQKSRFAWVAPNDLYSNERRTTIHFNGGFSAFFSIVFTAFFFLLKEHIVRQLVPSVIVCGNDIFKPHRYAISANSWKKKYFTMQNHMLSDGIQTNNNTSTIDWMKIWKGIKSIECNVFVANVVVMKWAQWISTAQKTGQEWGIHFNKCKPFVSDLSLSVSDLPICKGKLFTAFYGTCLPSFFTSDDDFVSSFSY